MRATARNRGATPFGTMNRTEKRYSERLEMMRLAGEIVSWRFEPITFRLAKATSYRPDFMVVLPNGEIEFADVKGRKGRGPGGWEDAAKTKIKIVTDKFPEFRFYGVTQSKAGAWEEETFG